MRDRDSNKGIKSSLLPVIKMGEIRYVGPSLTYSHYVFLINNTLRDLSMMILGPAIPGVFFMELIHPNMQIR